MSQMTAEQGRPGVSFFRNKFYLGVHDDPVHGFDYSHDDYTPLARYNPDRKVGDGQIEILHHETWRSAERAIASGNIDATSLTNITVIDLLREVIRRQWREFNARQATKTIPVPKLQLNVPITDKYTASTEVPELVAADQKSNVFTQAQLRLFKNVVDIYESDESRLKATIEPLNFEIDQAAGALGLAANDQIALEIETATTAGKADWGTVNATHGRSDRNPLDDILAEFTVINGNHFRPNRLCMHPRVAGDFLTNTFINGQLPPNDMEPFGTFSLPKFPGIMAVVDQSFTDTAATLLDTSVMLLGEGPTVAEQFRDPHRGADGWVIRQWLHPLLTTSDGAREMTTVSA